MCQQLSGQMFAEVDNENQITEDFQLLRTDIQLGAFYNLMTSSLWNVASFHIIFQLLLSLRNSVEEEISCHSLTVADFKPQM